MAVEVDHYNVLGLPSGEEGSRFSEQHITKGYRSKARELHPDKRPDDPNAHANFLKLQTSYSVLRDEKARKLFDDLLRVKSDKIHGQDSKRRRMVSDLVERERCADASAKARREEEEERIGRQLKAEIARIRAMRAEKIKNLNVKVPVVFSAEKYDSKVSSVGYQAFENLVLEKLRKSA